MRGIRVDYLSPTLYALDILIVFFLLSLLPLLTFQKVKTFFNAYKIPLLALVGIFLISTIVAVNKLVAVYGFVRLLELFFFGLGAKAILQKEGEKALPKLGLVFGVGILTSACIAFSQFFKQGSIGGILYFIGERSFSSETPGIANASINGILLMRPYATFPHPNVLAWYLFIGTAICISVLLFRKRYALSPVVTAILILATTFGSATIFLSLSRSVVFVFITFVLFLPFIFFKKLQKKMLIGFYSGVALLLIGLYALTPLGGRIQPLFRTDKALVERSVLLVSAKEMTRQAPLSGVGINNFLVMLPDFYPPSKNQLVLQPVHNIYVLALAETGLLGFSLLFFLLWKAGLSARSIKDQKIRFVVLYLLLSTALLGVVDHYMVTLEQGQILFTFLITCCFAFGAKKKQIKKTYRLSSRGTLRLRKV